MGSTDISSATTEFIKQSSTVTWFGHDFNVYAMILILIFVLMIVEIYRAHKNDKIDIVDLVMATNQITGKREISTTRLFQLIGGLTATFVVIKLTLQALLTWDIFAIYLSYVASTDGFTRFILAKYGVQSDPSNSGSPKP